MTSAPVSVVELVASVVDGVEVVAGTHIGPVRSENQDVFAATAMPGGGLGVLVADGMGGLPGGRQAAEAASAAALRVLAGDQASALAAVVAANRAVDSVRVELGGNPGTTLTVLAFEGSHGEVAHAGDSRAYLVRDGVASPLTTDHSWVGDQVRSGALPPGSERRHNRRNVITMAVMGDPIEPQVVRLEVRHGDVVALCSDGFWEPLSDEDIADLLSTPGPLTAVVERAVEAALAAGATDNVTVAVVRIAR